MHAYRPVIFGLTRRKKENGRAEETYMGTIYDPFDVDLRPLSR